MIPIGEYLNTFDFICVYYVCHLMHHAGCGNRKYLHGSGSQDEVPPMNLILGPECMQMFWVIMLFLLMLAFILIWIILLADLDQGHSPVHLRAQRDMTVVYILTIATEVNPNLRE